ncbi:GGDEF domain-containing protein [Marinobacter nauticus]
MLYRLKNDFRLSIITLLGVSAVFGVAPFAVLRFLQGNSVAFVVDVLILAGVAVAVNHAWRTGDTRRAGLLMACVASYGAVLVGALVGDPGLFWLYPCLITTFFLTHPRVALGINVSAVLLMMLVSDAFRTYEQAWSFAATAAVVTASAHVFAYRNRSQRRRLEHLATIDPLTGVKNRRSMDHELDMAVAAAERTGEPQALVLLDIDHFKRINDRHGHVVGDGILVDLVSLIDTHTRKYDQLFRFGGEEFVLLLPSLGRPDLDEVMGGLHRLLRRRMKYPGGLVTVSFGVATLQSGESVESWLTRADDALYQAKDAGRDRIVYADGPAITPVPASA